VTPGGQGVGLTAPTHIGVGDNVVNVVNVVSAAVRHRIGETCDRIDGVVRRLNEAAAPTSADSDSTQPLPPLDW
jgi:hypothetical protein